MERDVSRAKMVDVDFAAIDEDSGRAASALAVDLFDGTTLVVDKDRFVRRGSANYTWYGAVRGHPHGRAILTVVDGRMAGSIFLADPHAGNYAIYAIEPTNDGLQAVKEIRQDGLQPEEPGHFHAPSSGGKDVIASPQADSGDLIDVLVVFSNQTAAAVGAGIGAQVQAAIDNTNQVYANSGITQRLRLVHYQQVNYDEHGGNLLDCADRRYQWRRRLVPFPVYETHTGLTWSACSSRTTPSAESRGSVLRPRMVSASSIAAARSATARLRTSWANMGALHDPCRIVTRPLPTDTAT
jgi:hypothetical protein